MDREALIAALRGRIEEWCGVPCTCSDCRPIAKAADALASDAKLLEELKGLCDDVDPRGIGLAGLVSEIRAIFSWNATTKDLHTKTTKGDT